MSFSLAVNRALRAVERAMGKKTRQPRRARRAVAAARVRVPTMPPPRVLSEVLRASVEEGLISETEAWELSAGPDVSLRVCG